MTRRSRGTNRAVRRRAGPVVLLVVLLVAEGGRVRGRLVLPDEGIGQQLSDLLNPRSSGVTAWSLILYQTQVDPNNATTWGALTECTFSGYSRVSLTRSLWTTPVVSLGLATSTWGTVPVSWTIGSGAQDVAGFAYLDPVALVLRAILEFTAALTLNAVSDLAILPEYSLNTDTCTPLP